jgi:hypothetical protein
MVRRRGDERSFSNHMIGKIGDEKDFVTTWLGEKVKTCFWHLCGL